VSDVSAAKPRKGTNIMKIFTIENDTNNITLHATVQDAEAVANAERFRNEAGLAKLATDWPAARLVEIWNSLPGVSPVKKFKDRQTAVRRIWKALETLGQPATAATEADEPAPVPEAVPAPDQAEEARVTIEPAAVAESTEPAPATPVAPQAPNVAPAEAPATKKTTARKAAPKTPKAPKAAKVAKSDGPREGSKMAQVIAMLQRENGATISEIMASMGWQKHTVRGFMAGAMKKAGFSVESFKPEGGERTYRISK
jgi:hypothetical protein